MKIYIVSLCLLFAGCQKELSEVRPTAKPLSYAINNFTVERLDEAYFIRFDAENVEDKNVILQTYRADGSKWAFYYVDNSGDQTWTLGYKDDGFTFKIVQI